MTEQAGQAGPGLAPEGVRTFSVWHPAGRFKCSKMGMQRQSFGTDLTSISMIHSAGDSDSEMTRHFRWALGLWRARGAPHDHDQAGACTHIAGTRPLTLLTIMIPPRNVRGPG
jgi:hypothetical protein